MNSKVTTVAEYYGIRILSFRVVANGTRRVFRGQGHVRLGDVLGLDGVSADGLGWYRDRALTKSNHSFSSLSITISNVS